jgi:4'-phosphopantetheinyl transferase
MHFSARIFCLPNYLKKIQMELNKIYAYHLTDDLHTTKLYDFLKRVNNKLSFKYESRHLGKERCVKSMLGEILVRHSIICNSSLRYSDIRLIKNIYGKASLQGISGIHFNISHSGEWLICGLSNKEIGIDIELMKHMDFKNIMKIFFSTQEQQYVLGSKNIKKTFFEIFTLKESYIKLLGIGLSKKLSAFSILKQENKYIINDSEQITSEFSLTNFSFNSKYQMSICMSDKTDFEAVDITYVNLNNLISSN